MKKDTIYNHAENKLYVKTTGDKIVIICSKESQQEQVMKRRKRSQSFKKSIRCDQNGI